MEIFEKLSPFMIKAGIIEVGRDRLKQVAHKLAFLLVTEELSYNSLQELLTSFDCPIYRCLTALDVEKYFNYRGTKARGTAGQRPGSRVRRKAGCSSRLRNGR